MEDTKILSGAAAALQLLACPFCGTAEPCSEMVRAYGKSDWRSKMRCTACGASSGWSGPMGHDESANAAIEIWNMRSSSASESLKPEKSGSGPRLVSNVVPN